MSEERYVYIVAHGDYSDHCVIAVFDDKELAEIYQRKIGADYLETHLLNPLADQVRGDDRHPHIVRMYRDGAVKSVELLEDYSWAPISWDHDNPVEIHWNGLTVHCFARDEQHAIKIANEKRIQAIAEGRWPESDK